MNTFTSFALPVMDIVFLIFAIVERFVYHDNLDSWAFMIIAVISLTAQLSVMAVVKEMKKYDFVSARKAELEKDLKSCRKLITEIENTIIEEEKELKCLELKKRETEHYSE